MTDPLTLIEAWQHGSLTAKQAAELSDWLRDPANAETFAREAFIHQRLRDVLHPQRVQASVGSGFSVQAKPTLRPSPLGRGRSVWYSSGIAAAALIALTLTAWFLRPSSPTPHSEIRTPQSTPVAMLSDLSPDAVFAAPGSDSADPMQLGRDLPPGVIRLASGEAQVMFKSGAVVDLVGPCEFDLAGPNRGHLTSGYVSVFVPAKAAGFTIETATQRFIDMGTRFIVWTTPGDGAEVHVLEGIVLVEDRSADSSAVASAGRSLHRGQSWRRATASSTPSIGSFKVDQHTPMRLGFIHRFGTGILMPTCNWEASAAGGEPAAWTSDFAPSDPLSWRLHGGAGDATPTFVDVTHPSRLRVTRACRFTGGLASAVAERMLPGRHEDLTLELLIKPADLVGREILFEAGGDANGFCLLLDGADLVLRLDADGVPDLAEDRCLQVIHRLTARDIADFMQVAAVIDIQTDRIELFVNGRSVGSAMTPHHGTPAGDIYGWAGGNPDALGGGSGYGLEHIGGDDAAALDDFTAFDGLIAVVRFYQNQRLTPRQILTNYQAMLVQPAN